MKAYRNLIIDSLKRGHTVSVFDGEEWAVKKSTNAAECFAAVESVDEAQLRISDSEGNKLGWALVSDDLSFDPEETVIDYTDNDYMRSILG